MDELKMEKLYFQGTEEKGPGLQVIMDDESIFKFPV
jgi:hypothetical protein